MKSTLPLLLLATLVTPAASAQCCGDCSGDGMVSINELIRAVGNAQQGCDSGPCCGDCDGDREVTINELVTAVNRALGGCPAGATATPSDTPTTTGTATPSDTPTATPSATSTPTPVRAVDNGDGTVTDLSTGLIWEKKVGGDGVPDGSNPRDADNRYPWHGRCRNSQSFCRDATECDPDEACQAGDQQGTRLTIFMFRQQQNDAAYAGYDDWRVPNLDELRSLRDLDEQPAIDPGFHAPGCSTGCLDLSDPDCNCTGIGPHWTATAEGAEPGRAWRIDFDNGAVVSSNRGDDLRVRLVRGP